MSDLIDLANYINRRMLANCLWSTSDGTRTRVIRMFIFPELQSMFPHLPLLDNIYLEGVSVCNTYKCYIIYSPVNSKTNVELSIKRCIIPGEYCAANLFRYKKRNANTDKVSEKRNVPGWFSIKLTINNISIKVDSRTPDDCVVREVTTRDDLHYFDTLPRPSDSYEIIYMFIRAIFEQGNEFFVSRYSDICDDKYVI